MIQKIQDTKKSFSPWVHDRTVDSDKSWMAQRGMTVITTKTSASTQQDF